MNGSSMALCNECTAALLATKLFAFFNGSCTIGAVLVVLIDEERIVSES